MTAFGLPEKWKTYAHHLPEALGLGPLLMGGRSVIPYGGWIGAAGLTADAIQAVGRLIMNDQGGLISRIGRAPFNGAEKVAEGLQQILEKSGVDTYRAAVYVAARQVPGLAEALVGQKEQKKLPGNGVE